MKKTEIVLTGGHAGTTALAVVRRLKGDTPHGKFVG